MKTASKVFIIISLVLGAICIFLGLAERFLSSLASTYEEIMLLTTSGVKLMIFGTVSLIVSIIALNKLSSATTHSQLVGISVCTILFCSLLGGIFMLLIKDEELKCNTKPEPPKI